MGAISARFQRVGLLRTAFDNAFDAWCQALSAAGFAVDRFLNPPASDSDIASFESAVGFSMPVDFKSLYLKANGQAESYRVEEPGPGKFVMPFFGSFDFISLDQALQQYKLWIDIYSESGDNFHRDFDHCTARDGDPVYAEYWRPGWVPFSLDGGGNSYAIDLSPAPGGEYGQVILIGSDEDERRVLASSLGELLARATTNADINAQIADRDKGVWRLFNIER